MLELSNISFKIHGLYLHVLLQVTGKCPLFTVLNIIPVDMRYKALMTFTINIYQHCQHVVNYEEVGTVILQ
jgi:hypothetical protein